MSESTKFWSFDAEGTIVEMSLEDADLFYVYTSKERAAVVALEYLRKQLANQHEMLRDAEARCAKTLEAILALRREFPGL